MSILNSRSKASRSSSTGIESSAEAENDARRRLSRRRHSSYSLAVLISTPLHCHCEKSCAVHRLSSGDQYRTQRSAQTAGTQSMRRSPWRSRSLWFSAGGDIGGGGFPRLLDAESKSVWTLDFRETAPVPRPPACTSSAMEHQARRAAPVPARAACRAREDWPPRTNASARAHGRS